MFITIREIIDVIIMSAIIGYIFKDIFRFSYSYYSHYGHFKDYGMFSLNNSNLFFSIMVVAPAIVLHEFAHKFTAIAFGLNATFHASYFGLLLGLTLKLLNFPFLFFIPGYVQIMGGTVLENSIIAFAGPFTNFLLWFGSAFIINKYKNLSSRAYLALHITKQLNLFLFIFNMIPFPPFDGYTFFSGIIKTLLAL